MRTALLIGALLSINLAVGCKKAKPTPPSTTPATTAPATSNGSAGGDSAMFPGVAGGIAANPQAAGGGGGGGAIQAVRGAAKRAATQNDLRQIQLVMEDLFNTNGKMPSSQETLAGLQRTSANLAGLISDGTITLTGAQSREQVWAYESAALTNGGMMLSGSGIERVDAATLRQRLGR